MYDEETRAALATLGPRVDPAAARMWDDALASHVDRCRRSGSTATSRWATCWSTPRARLAAVIDFGTSGVGDPACDLVIAWTLLRRARAARRFVEGVGQDDGTWARARGWALWKALITAGRVGRRAAARGGRPAHAGPAARLTA